MTLPPETQLVHERGDKTVTLDQRLDAIETQIISLTDRTNRLFLMFGTLLTIANGPGIVESFKSLLGL